MKGLLAVAWREIGERGQALLAAAIAGLVPFLIPVIRGLHGTNAADARQWTALILTVAFGIGLALGLGLTTLAGDIATRRIAFYWSRPLSGWSIWLGKLLGVWLLSVAAALLACLPSLAVDGIRVAPSDLNSLTPALFLLALTGILILSHAVSIVVRSRSVLLLSDLLALGLAYLAVRAMSLRLLRLRAGGAVVTNFSIAEISLGVGLVAGGAAAVLVGRIQIRKAHRALSTVLWAVVAGGLTAVAAHSLWALTATPSSISRIDAVAPGAPGGWITLEGYAREDYATFAFNVNDRRFRRVPTTFRPLAMSKSASRAIWLEPDAGEAVRVVSWNLSRVDSKPVRTELVLPAYPFTVFLSDDGARLAAYDYEVLSVYDLGSGALLGSARAPGRLWVGQGLFLTSDRIRLFLEQQEAQETRIGIFEFDVGTRTLRRTGAITGVHLDPFATVSPDGSRVIVRDVGASRVALCDGVTGKQEAILADENQAAAPACFLSANRVAVAAGRRIRVFTPDGQIESDLPLPTPAFGLLGAPVEGRLSLSLREGRAAAILNMESSRVEELPGLIPPPRSWWQEKTDPAPPGSDFSALFSTKDGGLVKVDPVSLRREVVLPPVRH